MSATAMPLPLELTKPITLAADLDTQLRESLGVGKYDPKMQISTWLHGSFTKSNAQCNTYAVGTVVIDGDVNIDDNL
jgi:hypothetical protein